MNKLEFTDVRISYAFDSVVRLEEVGAMHLLDIFARIKSGEIPHDVAPPGFVAAIEKLPEDASREHILQTILGEVTALIIREDVPLGYPSERHGFSMRVGQVAYMQTPQKLPPPNDAVPQVVHPASSSIH